MLRRIFAARYSSDDCGIDFLSPATQLSAVPSGRLSFVFIAQHDQCKVFLKIVKPGLVHSNIPFSVLCTEQCRLHSDIPTFRTYPGKDGQCFQQVPVELDNLSPTDLAFFRNQYMTLTQAAEQGIDEIPEKLSDIPGGRVGQLALMQALGEYVVEVSEAIAPLVARLANDAVQLQQIDTSDPAGFNQGRQVLSQVFQLTDDMAVIDLETSDDHRMATENRLKAHVENLVGRLSDDATAQNFKHGLLQGDLLFIMRRFNRLQTLIEQNLQLNPAQNVPIHNEVKPANIGAVYQKDQQCWMITQSFDFDNMAWGNEINGDATPIEKDLGRTISFFAFDPVNGDFLSENAFAVCKGFLQRLQRRLDAAEVDRLIYYIQLGVVTSYLWRSSYFADELHGKPSEVELDRLDPSIHVKQLKAFDQWLQEHDVKLEFEKLY